MPTPDIANFYSGARRARALGHYPTKCRSPGAETFPAPAVPATALPYTCSSRTIEHLPFSSGDVLPRCLYRTVADEQAAKMSLRGLVRWSPIHR